MFASHLSIALVRCTSQIALHFYITRLKHYSAQLYLCALYATLSHLSSALLYYTTNALLYYTNLLHHYCTMLLQLLTR